MTSLAKRNYLSELRSLDWDFRGQTGSDGLAGYHWYPARYVPQVPGILIGYLSSPGDRVLDPFCGSGTTLVEARRLGRGSYGIDTNPVAVLVARAKLIELEELEWKTYEDELRSTVERGLLSERSHECVAALVPNYAEQSAWYHERTLHELACIWEAISSLDGPLKPVAEVAFSAILRFACSQDKHWGWVCDNVKPASLVYRDATKMFFSKLEDFPNCYRASLAATSENDLPKPASSGLHVGRCADVLTGLDDNSFDLIVTSPPYFSMTDYARSQRLTFLWYGWNLHELKSTESGARYKRHRQAALSQYLDEMRTSFEQMARVVKPGGACCVIVGESPNRLPYLDQVRDSMVAAGFRIEARIQRRVATQRTFAQLQHEEIIIAKRR